MDRLWNRTERQPSGCLEWQGALDPSGYGAIGFDGKKVNTHRLAYSLSRGEIPEGMCVCHTCDNRKCIEPEHLWLGTRGDNNRDRHEKGRTVMNHDNAQKTHCAKGHEYSPENTRIGKGPKGKPTRTCIACQTIANREYMRRYRAKLKAQQESMG